MFVNSQRLDQVLDPTCYTSRAFFEREQRTFFSRSWHLVGTRKELAQPGSFITFDIGDVPVIVRNFEGQLCAFVNVCAHRHCLLTAKPRGIMRELRCQYHGWGYDARGTACKIPDPASFQPFHQMEFRLRKLRVDTCGALVFVSLAAQGPSLTQFLDVNAEPITAMFGDAFECTYAWTIPILANWKIAVENSLESYHIPSVHPNTFGRWPHERELKHTLGDTFTRLDDPFDVASKLTTRFLFATIRRLRRHPTGNYTHLHCFPNLMFVETDLHSIAMTAMPISESRSLFYSWFFLRNPERDGWVAKIMRQISGRILQVGSVRVLNEDASIFSSVQRGLTANVQRGVIGRREERIHVFQNYVRAATDSA